MNGDGKPDLVVALYFYHSVGVLLGNGDGTFQAVTNYDSGGTVPMSVAVADLSGDGKSDIAVANYCNSSGLNCTTGLHWSAAEQLWRPQILDFDLAHFQPESIHLRAESNLDRRGYIVRLNHADRKSAVHVEWLHDWFGHTQQQRRGDSHQIKSQRRLSTR